MDLLLTAAFAFTVGAYVGYRQRCKEEIEEIERYANELEAER